MSNIRVVIADDHPLIIEGLGSALLRYGVEVGGYVCTAPEVIAKYNEIKPDVLILDVRFGEGANGLDVARELLIDSPDARIVFYSQFDEDELVQEAYRMGGAAFITKNIIPSVLADAIRQVHEGRKTKKPFFLPGIAERLALLGVRGDDSPQAKLERRELEVFKLMAQGLTNVEIAERMNQSPRTISTISQHIKETLGVHRPADVTRLALKHLLIEP